ncbi:hypothetical protein ACSBR1_011226 [Camellia fascicularis]
MSGDSLYRVDTTARLAQWRIENLASCTYRKSDPFKIGKWNWHLTVEKNRMLFIKLYPEVSNLTRDNPPIASFIIRVICSVGDRKALIHPEITDKRLKNNDDFVWAIEVPLTGKFIIDVEFLDLKIVPPDAGGEPCSIWAESSAQKQSNATALSALGKMLSEGIHTDIVINASDGSIGAHRAVLAAQSPVFRDLKEACHESLLEDIDTENVLERLQNASLYRLPKLKANCMQYLVKFGKIFDIRDDFDSFMQCTDRELVAEIFHEVLASWKGF